WAALAAAEAARDAAAARLRVEPLDGAAVEVDSGPLDGVHEAPVRRPTTIVVPGRARALITPGSDPTQLSEHAERCRRAWSELLQQHQVQGLQDAREQAERHRELTAALDRSEQELRHALAEDSLDELVLRCQVLADRLAGGIDAVDENRQIRDEGDVDIPDLERRAEQAGTPEQRTLEGEAEVRREVRGLHETVAAAREERVRAEQRARFEESAVSGAADRLLRARQEATDKSLQETAEQAAETATQLRADE